MTGSEKKVTRGKLTNFVIGFDVRRPGRPPYTRPSILEHGLPVRICKTPNENKLTTGSVQSSPVKPSCNHFSEF